MVEKMRSDFRIRKCAKKEQQLVDRISQLPNEILVHIFSFLTLKDSVRASVLSKRWIDLWTFVARLDFDASKDLEVINRMDFCSSAEYNIFLKKRRYTSHKYVKWVNKVLQSHKSMVLDVFRICFDMDNSYQNHIDKWLQYAFARRVQRLEFNLGDGVCSLSNTYAFPAGLLGLSDANSSAVSFPGYFENGINSHTLFGFKSLRALTFKNVLVSGEIVEFFLHNCPFLEYLAVNRPGYLKKLKVCGPSLALKHLELICCPELRSLTVCDTNIVSLKTTEGRSLVLKNVPMLVDVYVGGWFRSLISGAVSLLSCCLSKLEVLTLRAKDSDVQGEIANDAALPQLTKLKQFTLVVMAGEDRSLIAFTSLIRVSPNLEKFILKSHWQFNIARVRRESEKGVILPLQHLKVVELCGYYGRTTEVELVEYFIENAVALEKIIVDPHELPLLGSRHRKPDDEGIIRNLAKRQLEELVPSHVELVLL